MSVATTSAGPAVPASTPRQQPAAPRVLVLMAACNGVRWIAEQIDSILAQQGVRVELRISDDLSTDGTAELVEARYGGDLRVRLHRRRTASGGAAANFLELIAATSSYGFDAVALADQDDVWITDKLARAHRALAGSAKAAYSASVRVGTEPSSPIQRQCATLTTVDFLFEGAGQGCTFVLRPDFFERVRTHIVDHAAALEGFHFHDWLIYLLARAWELEWYFDAAPSMFYRQHDGNEIGARGGWASARRRWKRIANGWYRSQVLQAATLYELAGGHSPAAAQIVQRLRERPGAARRLALGCLLFVHSRRRRTDRLVVSVAAWTGRL